MYLTNLPLMDACVGPNFAITDKDAMNSLVHMYKYIYRIIELLGWRKYETCNMKRHCSIALLRSYTKNNYIDPLARSLLQSQPWLPTAHRTESNLTLFSQFSSSPIRHNSQIKWLTILCVFLCAFANVTKGEMDRPKYSPSFKGPCKYLLFHEALLDAHPYSISS